MPEHPEAPKPSSNYLFGSRSLEILVVLTALAIVGCLGWFFLKDLIFPVATLAAIGFAAYEDWKGLPGNELSALYSICSILLAVSLNSFLEVSFWILVLVGIGSFLLFRYPLSIILFMIKDMGASSENPAKDSNE